MPNRLEGLFGRLRDLLSAELREVPQTMTWQEGKDDSLPAGHPNAAQRLPIVPKEGEQYFRPGRPEGWKGFLRGLAADPGLGPEPMVAGMAALPWENLLIEKLPQAKKIAQRWFNTLRDTHPQITFDELHSEAYTGMMEALQKEIPENVDAYLNTTLGNKIRDYLRKEHRIADREMASLFGESGEEIVGAADALPSSQGLTANPLADVPSGATGTQVWGKGSAPLAARVENPLMNSEILNFAEGVLTDSDKKLALQALRDGVPIGRALPQYNTQEIARLREQLFRDVEMIHKTGLDPDTVLLKAVNNLRQYPVEREMARAYLFEDLTHKEIAKKFKTTEKIVRNGLARVKPLIEKWSSAEFAKGAKARQKR